MYSFNEVLRYFNSKNKVVENKIPIQLKYKYKNYPLIVFYTKK